MKWYIWAGIAVALVVIGFFGYKMFIKKDDVATTNNSGSSSNETSNETTGETTTIVEEVAEVPLTKVA